MSPLVALVLAGSFASPQSPVNTHGPTKVLSAKSLPNLKVNFYFSDYKNGSTPENVIRSFTVVLDNKTDFELASVTLRLKIRQAGRTIYLSEPKTFRTFVNVILSNRGSGLPHQRIQLPDQVSFEHRSELWNSQSRAEGQVVSAEVYLPNQNLSDRNHCLAWLLTAPDTEIIARLRKDPSILKSPPPNTQAAICRTAFAFASALVLKEMLRLGPRPPLVEPGFNISLAHWAAENAHVDALTLAVSLGCPVDAQSNLKQTPLDFALAWDNRPAIDWLLKHGANPKKYVTKGEGEVLMAIRMSSIYSVQRLLDAGVGLRWHGPDGIGPMQYAAVVEKAPELLQFFMKRGLSVNDRDPKMRVTPLMYAASAQANDAAVWLIRHGARFDLKDATGQDVWDYAKKSNTLHTDSFFREALKAANVPIPPRKG